MGTIKPIREEQQPGKKNSGIISSLSIPVELLVKVIHKKFKIHLSKRKITTCTLGITFMFCGTVTAMHGESFIGSHVAADVLGYFIHGAGCAPILKIISDWLKVEI